MVNIECFEPDELLALAKRDMEQGELEKALAKLKLLVSQSEQASISAMTILARLYAQLGMYDRSREWYSKIVSEDPQSPVVRFELGMTHFDTGEHDVALSVWRDLLDMQPDFPPALYYTALSLANGGDEEEASLALKRLFQNTDQENLYYTRGQKLQQSMDDSAASVAETQH